MNIKCAFFFPSQPLLFQGRARWREHFHISTPEVCFPHPFFSCGCSAPRLLAMLWAGALWSEAANLVTSRLWTPADLQLLPA